MFWGNQEKSGYFFGVGVLAEDGAGTPRLMLENIPLGMIVLDWVMNNLATDKCCLGCGYSLRGLVEKRCPECGNGFDPEDAATFIRAKSVDPALVRFLRPVRWPGRMGQWGAILFLIVVGSTFMYVPLMLVLWVTIYLSIAVPCMLRSWVRRWIVWRYKIDRSALLVDWFAYAKARFWLSAVLLLGLFRVPQVICFAAEYPFLKYEIHHLYYDVGMFNYDSTIWCGITLVHVDALDPGRVQLRPYLSGNIVQQEFNPNNGQAIGGIETDEMWSLGDPMMYDIASWAWHSIGRELGF